MRLGRGASLHARPGPLVASRNSQVDVTLDLDLAEGALLDWREMVVLGRSAEEPGTATMRWDVIRDGRAVLRQHVDLRDSWRGLRDGHRVLATALVSGTGVAARTVVRSATAVAARLDEHTVLATVLAGDAATARHEVDALCAVAYGA